MRILIFGLIVCAALASASEAACRLDQGLQRTVARTLDGETIQFDDGSIARLAGIVAPRARDAGVADDRWPPQAAATSALDQLVTSKAVMLRFDATRRDRHGKLLAYVYLADAPDGPSIQERLLADGHARVDAIEGERACIGTLLAAEAEARRAARGLWSEPIYRVRSAIPARDVAAFRITFQIISGVVTRVESGRGVVRLILGDDRRKDVSLLVRSTDRETAGALGGDLKKLQGQRVEARGWVVQRPYGGPEIDVSLAGHVRVMDGG